MYEQKFQLCHNHALVKNSNGVNKLPTIYFKSSKFLARSTKLRWTVEIRNDMKLYIHFFTTFDFLRPIGTFLKFSKCNIIIHEQEVFCCQLHIVCNCSLVSAALVALFLMAISNFELWGTPDTFTLILISLPCSSNQKTLIVGKVKALFLFF